MDANIPHAGHDCNPHAGHACDYPVCMDNLSANLGQLMRDRGISPYDLQDRASVPKSTLYRILKGNHDATMSTVHRIARALRVPAWTLLCPPGELSLLRNPEAAEVLRYLGQCAPESRALILQVARAQALTGAREAS